MYSNMTVAELESLLDTDRVTIAELTKDSHYILTMQFEESVPLDVVTSTCNALKHLLADNGINKCVIVPVKNGYIKELGVFRVTD